MFFALWPDPVFQIALARAVRDVVPAAGGRPVPPENFHVTLAFLGSVPEARIAALEVIAAQVAGKWERPSLQLTFDVIEYWKKPGIVCATERSSSSASAPLAQVLADSLKAHLIAAGFAPDLKPFRTHVTLARKVPRGTHDRSMQSVLWTCSDFALVDSHTGAQGSVYSVLKSWPLCTQAHKMPGKKDK